MASVDSGVETGNDSNDSSIVQHENLMVNTISNVSSAGTSSSGSVVPSSSKGLECKFSIHSSSDHGKEDMTFVSSELYLRPKQFRMVYKSHRYKHDTTYTQIPLMERKMRLAAATNNIVLITRLLNTGISPNNSDDQGRTPLHHASCRGYTEMVNLLLEYGANPNQRDCIGNTPLHLATRTNKISVVMLLLKWTDVSSLNQDGFNPLHLAQGKLKLLQRNLEVKQRYDADDTMRVKEELDNIASMLLLYMQKQKDMQEKVETLSNFCSRLSLSNTSDEIQDGVKDLLANLDAFTITS